MLRRDAQKDLGRLVGLAERPTSKLIFGRARCPLASGYIFLWAGCVQRPRSVLGRWTLGVRCWMFKEGPPSNACPLPTVPPVTNMKIPREKSVSCAFAALIMAIFVGRLGSSDARAADTPGSPPVNAEEPKLLVLTESRLQTLIALNQARGTDFTLSGKCVTALRLNSGSNGIQARQLVCQSANEAFAFYQFKETIPGYIFGVRTPDGLFIYYVDGNLDIISFFQQREDHSYVQLPLNDQRRGDLLVIYDTWAKFVDSQPPPGN